ncbi:MAG: pantoate--beta-alanine ligase [Clostridiales bacterium]|nr:pantoate--beta-alanine ligase [Clostridiales bacterium]
MKILKTVKEVKDEVKAWRKEGLSVGLVPTMGWLHEGHLSLIKNARENNDRVVVSDFVNPLQFGPNEDYDNYPRDLDRDAGLCEKAGVDVIFAPGIEEMYPEGFCSYVDMNGLTGGLCGKTRPIHFRGVQTVVNKLFNIVTPDNAYFGEKDAQQLAVIKRMVLDLNMNVKINGCPIIREEDGLAKSSRNSYLSPEERKAAPIINKAMTKGREMIKNGERDAKKVIDAISEIILSVGITKIDYVSIVDSLTLEPVEKIEKDILCACAVYMGNSARLIDNFSLEI